ncbi:MAG TPA: hypothetical protein VJL84_03155 [Kiloniellales bacterium]|nr:hypothetical protein [Kiloniellales bacterium]
MDFIFMLTRQDQTVVDCLEVFQAIRGCGLTHVGFKDIGVERDSLRRLHDAIKESGATSYMEVVATSPEAMLRSARVALELGVDRLMGGTAVAETLKLLQGSGIAYYPFPGRPEGHPTKLGGSPAEVEQQCRIFMEQGCAGADLLAYRATEAEPLALVRAARRGLGKGHLICAGSVDSPARIAALAEAGCDGFTIGSAAFDGSFAPRRGLLTGQLAEILAAAKPASRRAAV